ncbi:MAG: phosphoribosylglycinamide formyltransferase [Bacteroidetes bacterium]|nr:phosphoribosylglycinamide formyltransferase [Bacteroidota bacterium]MDA0873914.1 phosphoribosylglycinamide formyltransferase [Bacteroidota bacterium]
MNIAVFASGGGSNFQALADACQDGRIRGRIALCVASRETAGVIQRAERLGIPVHVLRGSTEEWTASALEVLRTQQVEFIALAGFMRMVPADLIRAYPDRIVNIHPALLPDFGGHGMFGMNVHRAVIASGAARSGATVHLVDEDYDTGPIVAQEAIDVRPSDSAEDLATRVLEVEHRLYPAVVAAFAEGRVHRDGASITIQPSSSSPVS